MAKYGSKDLKIEFDNAGGEPVDMSAYIDTISAFDPEMGVVQTDGFGEAWEAYTSTGYSKLSEITLGGSFDNTATTGPHAIFNARGATRSLTITWDGSTAAVTDTVETIITKYSKIPTRGELTRFEVVLRPTGAVS